MSNKKILKFLIPCFLTLCFAVKIQAQSSFNESEFGIYKNKNSTISISPFDFGDGTIQYLMTNYSNGDIRILTKINVNTYISCKTLLPDSSQLESSIVIGQNTLSINRSKSNNKLVYQKIDLSIEDLELKTDFGFLSGTLIKPKSNKKRPLIIMLHGSGPLNRYSFGPYPLLIALQGFSVFIYDKRGIGQSKGDFEKATYTDLSDDANLIVEELSKGTDIDKTKIGIFGTSQGGFLESMVASKNNKISFVINVSGMATPVWEQESFRTLNDLESSGVNKNDIADANNFMTNQFALLSENLMTEIQFQTIQQKDSSKSWYPQVLSFDNYKEMQSSWKNLYSFSPLPYWKRVKSKVICFFGVLDKSTPVNKSIQNLKTSINKKQLKIYKLENVNHSMFVCKTGFDNEIPQLTKFSTKFITGLIFELNNIKK